MLVYVVRGERAPTAGHEPPGSGVDPEGAVERGVHGVRTAKACARAATRPRPSCAHARQGTAKAHFISNVNETS